MLPCTQGGEEKPTSGECVHGCLKQTVRLLGAKCRGEEGTVKALPVRVAAGWSSDQN